MVEIRNAVFDLPKVKPFDGSLLPEDVPQITRIEYDLQALRITLEFEAQQSSIISFESVCGFRVLDEGDLLEFWQPDVRCDGYIWQVVSGGWFSLEKIRNGFVPSSNAQEYLIVGVNECVSVISKNPPNIDLRLNLF